jgi:hypothetical protein
MGKLRVLDSTGDTVLDWDVDDNEAVREAELLFRRLVDDERRMAFARPAGGTAADAELIRAFDPSAEEILMVKPIQGG